MEKIREIFDKYVKKGGIKTQLEAAMDYYLNNLDNKGYSYQDIADRWGWSKGATYNFISRMDSMPKPEKPVKQESKKEKKQKSTVRLQGAADRLLDMKHPPDGSNMKKKYFYIAKGFHTLFCEHKGFTKTLKEASAEKWTDDVRKLVELDKVTIEQLVAIKMYWDAIKDGEKGLDSFWFDTIHSMAAFRHKSKSGVYYWDMIVAKVKEWVEGDPRITAKVHEKVKNYKKYVGID